MIIVRFGGGLGNQLFQYAFLVSLKAKYPMQKFLCDISQYGYFNEHNGFVLDRFFEFNEEFLGKEELRRIKPLEYYMLKHGRMINNLFIYSFLYKAERYIQKHFKNDSYIIVTEREFQKVSVEAGHDYYFEGSWQDINRYNADLIRENIKFHVILNDYERSIMNEMNEFPSIAVHIRRGDYTCNNGFNICTVEYYKRAIDVILKKEHLDIEKTKLFFFSDDHSYVEETFSYPNMKLVTGQSEGNEMFLISIAKLIIIANSTFSFWGAFLNKDATMVVAPRYFFKTKKKAVGFHAPREWTVLDID